MCRARFEDKFRATLSRGRHDIYIHLPKTSQLSHLPDSALFYLISNPENIFTNLFTQVTDLSFIKGRKRQHK